jgi:hypothetical protein
MSKNESLFLLVRSLAKHEKKHFRLFVSLRGGEKKYLGLFDAIDAMKEYDEKVLRKKLAGEKYLKQLPVAKNYLNGLILKSLRALYAESVLESQLSSELKNVEILYEKGLYKNARSILNRIEKIAAQNEKFLRHLEIINWKRRLDRIVGYHALSEERLLAEEKTEALLIEKYSNMKKYDNLSDHFFILAAKTNLPSGKEKAQQLATLAKNKFLTDETNALSYKSRYVFNLVNSRLSHTSGNLEASYDYGRKQIATIEALPEQLFNEERYNYIIALYNQLIILNVLKKTDEFGLVLNKIRALDPRNIKEEITVFYSCLPEADHYLSNKEFAYADEFEARVVEGLEKFSGRINKQVELGLFYSLASLFLWKKDARRSLRWLNCILNNAELDIRTDVYCAARLLELLVHFDLKNYELLTNLSRAAHRYLKKKEIFGEMEELLLNYFGMKIPFAESVHKRRLILLDLKARVTELSSSAGHSLVFSMFDFSAWLEVLAPENVK